MSEQSKTTRSRIMMTWLPIPSDFRGDLRAALETPEPAHRLEKLAALAQHRLGFLETIQLDRALGHIPAESATGFVRVRLALLGSSTVDHLAPAIRIAGLRRRLLIDVHVGSYGQYRQEFTDSASPLYRFAPQIVLFSLTAREAVAGVPVTATVAEADAIIARTVEDHRVLWRKARETFRAAVIQQSFLDVSEPLFGSYDQFVPGTPARIISRLNERLLEAAAMDTVSLLDIARSSERDGIEVWFDTARWLQARMEIAPQAAPLYGELVARIVAAQCGLSKKCLVLDLDNTLWGGVIGDDGIDGIVLGEGTPSGEAHLALQRYAWQLKERGIILAVCSKNDPATAEAVFRDHPEMLLKRSDIAAFVANWSDKAENLKDIAARLNIGMDSLVLVDDNPAERARIRSSLPMVAVPELPDDPAHYVRCIADAGYFESVAFTSEDRQRAEQYAANAERDALLGLSESMDSFLRGLKMSVVSGPFMPVDLARVTQLINKTNQFNPTTRRYTAEEIAALAVAPKAITLQFRLLDRFGDNGLVSAMILRPDPGQSNALVIDSWVMSCRVFGRQLELQAMNIAVETARLRGARAIYADYIPTKKNGVIVDLYLSLGFNRVNGPSPSEGATRWALDVAEYVTRQTYIGRSGAAN
jgi:FkbH-like protein